jgi:hypothetical protein
MPVCLLAKGKRNLPVAYRSVLNPQQFVFHAWYVLALLARKAYVVNAFNGFLPL